MSKNPRKWEPVEWFANAYEEAYELDLGDGKGSLCASWEKLLDGEEVLYDLIHMVGSEPIGKLRFKSPNGMTESYGNLGIIKEYILDLKNTPGLPDNVRHIFVGMVEDVAISHL